MSRRTKQKTYNPSDVYLPLLNRDSRSEEMMEFFVDRASPFLPVRVLRPEKRGSVIGHVNDIRRYLWLQFIAILEADAEHDLGKSIQHRSSLPEVEDICGEVLNVQKRENLSKKLSAERALMTSELLAVLGFLPDNMLPNDEAELNAKRQERLFASDDERVLLHKRFPPWFGKEFMDHPFDVVPTLSRQEEREEFPKFAELALWMSSAQNDFQICIRDAFNELTQAGKRIAPKGPAGQAFETLSDLGTKSFPALLEMIMNKKLALRTRVEALRLLVCAIGLFSIRRNPVVQAQRIVREKLHANLQANFWPPQHEKQLALIKIDQHMLDLLSTQEIVIDGGGPEMVLRKLIDSILKIAKDVGLDDPEGFLAECGVRDKEFLADKAGNGINTVPLVARKVNGAVSGILERHSQGAVNPRSIDRVLFKSREKDDFPTALKILNYQSLHERCVATLQGMKTGMTKKYARGKLGELRRRMERRHRREDFEVKPVGIDSVDDLVGFSIAIDLQKPLQEYGREERAEVNGVFRALAKYLAKKLGLKHARHENHLWKQNKENHKSAEYFRVYKLHGDYEIEIEAFKGGRLVMTKLIVPVEIQLCPVESRLRVFYPGKVGDESYAKRKAADVEGFLFPRSIGDQPIFPAADVSPLVDEVLTWSVAE